uniref:Uncharacterized protein n=1 Tax=Glossina brevipalpis TaxID=37001 RepID=A0A1A9WGE3_9MUSC
MLIIQTSVMVKNVKEIVRKTKNNIVNEHHECGEEEFGASAKHLFPSVGRVESLEQCLNQVRNNASPLTLSSGKDEATCGRLTITGYRSVNRGTEDLFKLYGSLSFISCQQRFSHVKLTVGMEDLFCANDVGVENVGEIDTSIGGTDEDDDFIVKDSDGSAFNKFKFNFSCSYSPLFSPQPCIMLSFYYDFVSALPALLPRELMTGTDGRDAIADAVSGSCVVLGTFGALVCTTEEHERRSPSSNSPWPSPCDPADLPVGFSRTDPNPQSTMSLFFFSTAAIVKIVMSLFCKRFACCLKKKSN